MSQKIRKFVSIVGLMSLVLVLVIAPVSAQDGSTLTVGFAQEPDSLNGFYSSMAFAQWANDLVQASLWDVTDTLEMRPVLIDEVPSVENGGISEDYLTYTIKLKDGLLWSDGEPLTADDLVFTYQMIMDPANNFSQGSAVREAVSSVAMVDDTTFTITFSSPKPFPEDMAGSPGIATILPAHIYRPIYDADGSIEFADENQDPTVFSGPYVLSDWRRGEQMSFTPNANYVLGQPKIGEVVIRFFPDTDSEYAALAAGQIDFVPNISEGDMPRVAASSEDLQLVTVFGGYIESLWLNIRGEDFPAAGHVALQDPDVRTAIRYALDRDTITTELLAGATSGTDSVYANSPFEDTSLGVTPYDPEMAMQMLDDAGWVDSNNDGTRDKDGVELVLRYSTTDAQWRQNVQAVISQQLEAVGIGIVQESYPATEFFGTWANNGINASGNYDIAEFANNTALTNPANVTVYESLNCDQRVGDANPGGQNYTGYCNEAIDAAAQLTISSLDPAERQDAANTIQTILRDEAPVLTLFPRGDNYAYNTTRFANSITIGSGVGNTWFDILDWELSS
ncbi:MAG: peptide ABC transporter substrate-binding protein [Chloroflexota bacterium]